MARRKIKPIKAPKALTAPVSGSRGGSTASVTKALGHSSVKPITRGVKKAVKKIDKKHVKSAKAKAKAKEKAAKAKALAKARENWKGLQQKIKRTNERIAIFQDPNNAAYVDWSYGYKAMQAMATSGELMKYFDRDTSAGTFSLKVKSFKDFKSMPKSEQLEYRRLVELAAEYKTMTLKGAAAKQQKSYESFKKNREKKIAYYDEDGKAHYKRRPALTKTDITKPGSKAGGYDTLMKVYNNYKAKDKDVYGSAMIDFIRNNLNIDALSEADINKLLDYSYNESLWQGTHGVGKEEIKVGDLDAQHIAKEFGDEMIAKWIM